MFTKVLNFHYFKFLFKSLLKSKLILIFIFLNILVNILFMSFMISDSPSNFLERNTILIYIVPFLFLALLAGIIGTNLFSDQEKDGYDLFVVSFQLKRSTIFTTKIITIILALTIYQLGWFFIYLILFSALGKNLSSKDAFILSSSLAFGGLIIQILFSQIAILISIVGKKALALLFTIMVTLFVPLGSFFVSPMLNAAPTNINELSRPLYISKIDVKNNKEYNNSLEDQYYHDNYTSDVLTEIKEYNKINKYKYFGLFDLWYHANNMLNMFNNTKKFDQNVIQKWVINNEKLESFSFLQGKENSLGFAVDKKKWATEKHNFDKEVVKIAENLNSYFNLVTNNAKSLFNDEANLAQRLLFVQMFLDGKKRLTSDQFLNKILSNQNDITKNMNTLLNIEEQTVFVYKYFLNNYSQQLKINIVPKHIISNLSKSQEPIGNFFKLNSSVDYLKIEPYYNVLVSISIFVSLSILLISASFYVFKNKEIK